MRDVARTAANDLVRKQVVQLDGVIGRETNIFGLLYCFQLVILHFRKQYPHFIANDRITADSQKSI